MQSIRRSVGDPQGSAIIMVIFVLLILTLGGAVAIDYANVEVKYSRRDIERKQQFYLSESAGHEVAYDVDRTTGNAYAVLDINTPIILTATSSGANASDPTAAEVTDYFDLNWPINIGNGDLNAFTALVPPPEYAYRVYYTGMGAIPKGFGANFASFVFDISTRVQETVGGNVNFRSAAIVQGFRKIGPKN
jgi:hypothetical protein